MSTTTSYDIVSNLSHECDHNYPIWKDDETTEKFCMNCNEMVEGPDLILYDEQDGYEKDYVHWYINNKNLSKFKGKV